MIDNPVGYYIDQDPGPMLVVHPGKAEARDWSKDHFDPMVRDTQCLHGKVNSDKIKDRKNEILHKSFPGGILYIIGSNSAAGFRQKTVQRVFLDDVDSYEISAGLEGDQIELARNRTITYMYHHRKIIIVSTPTIRGLSRVEEEYFKSDQRHYYVPCPFCNHYQVLIFTSFSQWASLTTSSLRFDDKNLSYCYYECANCHGKIEEKYKLDMIHRGQWRKSHQDVMDHAGFHLSELISPFSSWVQLARDFLSARKNREMLRVFVNQRLGETFVEEKTTEVDEDRLLIRREDYMTDANPHVPTGCLVLTAGIDVQADRLECIILGWGRNYECWFIDRRMIFGSPEKEKTWLELDEYLIKDYQHQTGVTLPPWSTNGLACVCVDSGYSTEEVYKYIKRRQSKRYFAIKGDDGWKKPFIINVSYTKRNNARLAAIAVDVIKARIYDRLNDIKNDDDTFPPGFIHFNKNCNEEFFQQLTSERIVIVKTSLGYPKRVWKLKEGFRNEVLDCFVYNFAAITLLNPNFEKLQEKLNQKVELSAVKAGPVAEEQSKSAGELERKPGPRRRRRYINKLLRRF